VDWLRLSLRLRSRLPGRAQKPEGVWPFAAANSKERAFLSRTAELRDRPGGQGLSPQTPPAVPGGCLTASVASDSSSPWEEATLAEGPKGPTRAKAKKLRGVPRGWPALLHQCGQRHLALHKGVRQLRHKVFYAGCAGGHGSLGTGHARIPALAH
jgi:hypothetical protein